MKQHKWLTSLLAFILAVYVFFAYELLLIPVMLEFSIWGGILSWVLLLGLVFLFPKEVRKPWTLFILLLIFTTSALSHIGLLVNVTRGMQMLVLLVAVFLFARFIGQIPKHIVASMLVAALVLHFVTPLDAMRMYTHFWKTWESPQLYHDRTVDYFPLLVRDVTGDGQSEIITFGNTHEQEEIYQERVERGIDPDKMPYDLEDERLFMYVFSWTGSDMERIANEDLDIEAIRPHLPKDYIGFPYFVWDSDFTLVPVTQKQTMAENMSQFGAMPFHVMNLNMEALGDYLETFNGQYDTHDQFRFDTPVEDISIKEGELIVAHDDFTLEIETETTKIIDLVQLEDDIGLLLLGQNLELWTFSDEMEEMSLTHSLSTEDINDLISSEYMAADITHDGSDEILISSDTSRIIKPLPDGEWDILFASQDDSLRFEDFATVGNNEEPQIVGLSKSLVRNNPLRFTTGFTFTDEGLEQDWKAFTSLINVNAADITGNGENELVATIWHSHKVFVFSKHGLPVTGGLLGILILLTVYVIFRRVVSR